MQISFGTFKLAVAALIGFTLAISSFAQVNSTTDLEEERWRTSEEKLQRTVSAALQFLAAPHTDAIRTALIQSQKNWETYRQSQCRLEATAMAFQRTFDERNVRQCLAGEADLRTRYIQNLVP